MSYKTISFCFSFLSVLFVPVFCKAQPGVISTIAGIGISGYTGDGGPATVAKISNPIQVITDAAGNVYFADNNSNVIRKISPSGIISTVAGTGVAGFSGDGGLATAAQLNNPWGIAVDMAGNLYIGDTYNQRIRKVSAAGIIKTIAGTGTAGYSGDGGMATAANLQIPALMRVDNSGNLYFCDNSNQRVRMINTSGIITTIAGNGIAGYTGDGGPATSAEVAYPAGVMPDGLGNVYISDAVNNVIRKVNSAGIISTVAGNGIGGFSGDGGPATSAKVSYPQDIFVDGSGNIYFADTHNERVRKINAAGIINTIAGSGVAGYSGDGGLATAAELNSPDGVYVDNSGRLYISDPANKRIREVVVNHPPHFTKGRLQSLTICENEATVIVDTLLAVLDTDAGQTETWSLTIPPAYGTATVTYTATSTGAVLTPVGLYYTPAAGFTGTDSFKVTVSDGTLSDQTEIHIIITPLPNAGTISGTDSVCPGHKDTLSETVGGGIWSYSNIGVTTISFSGVVTGIAPGLDTIIYTIISPCGIVSAIYPFKVRSDCPTGINTPLSSAVSGIKIFPNPAVDGEFTVNVFTNTEEDVQLTITNSIGQKIKEFTGTANKSLDIKIDAPVGIYFLTAATKDEKWNAKIILSSR